MAPVQVAAAVLIEDGQLLLAKRAPGSNLAGFWELPGGKVEKGETPEECLAREMLEEFGVRVSVGRLVAKSVHDYDHGAIELLAFRTEILSGELAALEHEAFGWFRLQDIERLDLAPADVPIIGRLKLHAKDRRWPRSPMT